jgi:hypothetical protein
MKINQSINEINLNHTPSKGTEMIVSSTKIMHDILMDYYEKTILAKIFSKEIMKIYLNKIQIL